MYESSDSHFLWTITRIKSGPDKLRLVTTILTNLGVMFIFRSVLEGRASKEMPLLSRLEFLEKFSENNSTLSDAEDNNSGPLN